MPNIKLKIEIDSSGAVKDVKKLDNELEDLKDDVKITPDVDTGPAEDKLEKLKKLMQFDVLLSSLDLMGDKVAAFAERTAATTDSMRIMKAQTGAIAEDFEFLKETAADLYASGVGETYADAAKAIATAKRTLGDFVADGTKGLIDFTRIAGGIAKVFDKDINEVIAGSRTFIANFKLEGQEAGELVAYAMQNASGKMDDVLDTLDEYSQLMVTAGYSAQEFTDIIVRGMQAGARDTDKLADAIKETQIRINAGDTDRALAGITAPIAARIQSIVDLGKAGVYSIKDVLEQSSKDIAKAVDSGEITTAIRDQLNTAISGTMSEDLGGKLYTKMFSADIDTAQLEKKAAQAAKLMQEAIEPKGVFESLEKQASVALDSVAASFAPVISASNSTLQAVSGIAPAMIMFGQFGGPIKSVATAFTGKFIPSIVASVVALKGATAAQTLLNVAMKAAPWGLAIAAIGGLVYAISELSGSYEDRLKSIKAVNDAELDMVKTQKELNVAQQKEEITTIKLVDNYTELASKSKLTAEEQDKLSATQDQLNEKYPGVITKTKTFDKVLLSLSKKAGLSKQKLTELRNEFTLLTQQDYNLQIGDVDIQQEIILDNMKKLFGELGSEADKYTEELLNDLQGYTRTAFNESELNEVATTANKRLQELRKNFKLSGEAYSGTKNFIKEYIDLQRLANKASSDFHEGLGAGSPIMDEWAKAIKKVTDGMENLTKNAYVTRLKAIKEDINNLPKAAFEEGEIEQLNSMIDKGIASWKRSADSKEVIDKKANDKKIKAQEAYEKFIAQSNANQIANQKALQNSLTNASIDGLEDRKQFLLDANKLAVAQIEELLTLEGRLHDLHLDEIGVKLTIKDDPVQMNRLIADKMNAEIAAVREREKGAQKLYEKGSLDWIAIQTHANNEVAGIERKWIEVNKQHRLKVTRETQAEMQYLWGLHYDAIELEAINSITDIAEQEKAIAVSEARKVFEARLDVVKGTYSLEYEAFLKYQRDKIAAEEAYLIQTRGLVYAASKQLALTLQAAFSEGLQLPDTSERKAALDEALGDINNQRDALLESYRNQEIDRGEFHSRMNELDAQRATSQKEYNDTQISLQDAINESLQKTFGLMQDTYINVFKTAAVHYQEYAAIIVAAEEEKTTIILESAQAAMTGQFDKINALKAKHDELTTHITATQKQATDATNQMWIGLGLSVAASLGQLAAAGLKTQEVIALSLLGALKQVSGIFIAWIWGKALADSGLIAGAIAATIATGIFLGFVAKAEADIKSKWTGGLIEGDEQIIRVNERGPEYVMNAPVTAKNLKAFEYINKHDVTVEEYALKHSSFKDLLFVPDKKDAQPINIRFDTRGLEEKLDRIEKQLGSRRLETENYVDIKLGVNDRELIDRIDIQNARDMIGV